MPQKRKSVEVTPDPALEELAQRRAIVNSTRDRRTAILNGEHPRPAMFVLFL